MASPADPDHGEVMATRTAVSPPSSTVTSARDRSVDLFRAAALGVVVLGHWFLAVVHWNGGHLEARNLLDAAPATQWATWLFQPMPLFFAVGGWAAARSWSGRDPGQSRARWVQRRLVRLLVPAGTYVVCTVLLVGIIVGVLGDTAAPVGNLLGMHLWFLAVYVPLTAAMPLVCDTVARFSWRVPLALGGAVVVVDILRFVAHIPGIGWANFVFVWTAFAAAGAAAARTPPRGARAVPVAVAATATLIGIVAAGWYPHSMVGVGDRSNNTPPTVALALLGLAQIAAAAACAPGLRRWLDRRRGATHAVDKIGTLGMHLYLWHLWAVVIVAAVMVTGWGDVEPLGPSWWVSRPVWWMVLASVAVPIAATALRIDVRRLAARAAPATAPSGDRGAAVAVTCAASIATAAFAVIALGGIDPSPLTLAAVFAVAAAGRLVAPRPNTRTGGFPHGAGSRSRSR